MRKESDAGNKLQILSKVNQNERTRWNELQEKSKTMIVNENYKLLYSSPSILCLKEHVKPVTKSKERFKRKCTQKIDETNNLNVKLKNENESGMKQKNASKENQDDITRLDEPRKLLENRAGKKKSTILCLNEDFTTIETSKEDFTKQLIEKRDETCTTSVKLKKMTDSVNKIKKYAKKIKMKLQE